MRTFSPDAIRDLETVCDGLTQIDSAVASRLFDRIRQKCKLVADFPLLGKRYEELAPDLRGFVVDDYCVFYYPLPDGIEVVRVINGRRDIETLFGQSDE
ncbi:type II toxin-antitoxin system RelE/ParE family toxin [Phormidesmis sp. 146-35]